MPLSEEQRKRYGCWVCLKYSPSDLRLPMLPRDCFLCTFLKISKGPYDKPCDEGFELNEALLEQARESLGNLVDSRLGLRQEATNIRIKQGTHELLDIPVDMRGELEVIFAERRSGSKPRAPEPRRQRLSESQEKSPRQRREEVPMVDKYAKPMMLSDMLQFHQAPMIDVLHHANPQGKIDLKMLSAQTKQMLGQLVLAKAVEQGNGKRTTYTVAPCCMHYLTRDLSQALLEEGLIPAPGLFVLPELPEHLRLLAFYVLHCANGDNTIRTLDLQTKYGQEQEILQALKSQGMVRIVTRTSRWYYEQPYLAWALAYKAEKISEAQLAGALGLNLEDLGLEAEQPVTRPLSEPVREESPELEGKEGTMRQILPPPCELPTIPVELREMALRCLLNTGNGPLYVKMQQAGITSADLPVLAEADVLRLNNNQPYIKRGFTKVVRMYLKGEATADDLACWIGLNADELTAETEPVQPVTGEAETEQETAVPPNPASVAAPPAADVTVVSAEISDNNGSHAVELPVVGAILAGLSTSGAAISAGIDGGSVTITFGETTLRLPLAT